MENRVPQQRRSEHAQNALFVIDLVQDLDTLLPIALASRAGGVNVTFCVTHWLIDLAPRIPDTLDAFDFARVTIHRSALMESGPDLSGFGIVFTASESTAAPHRYVHALVRRANSNGLLTCTIQHGLENVGLTSKADGAHDFASQMIFIWNEVAMLPDWVPAARRRRCVAVGRPQAIYLEPPTPAEVPDSGMVAVFENLHWDRYPPEYAARFLSDLDHTIGAYPDLTWVIKPHPAGRWLTKNPDALARRKNVTIADPTSEAWRNISSEMILQRAVAAITTPSTVALDAACLAVPVAVARYGLDIPAYQPLPFLNDTADWLAFLDAACADRGAQQATLEAFRHRHLIAGDAGAKIAAMLSTSHLRRQ